MSSAFTYTQDCPHICWLGINPSVTTTEEARNILSSSNQIKQTSYIGEDAGFGLEWYLDSEHPLPIRVYVTSANGIVQKLIFRFNILVKIQEFIDLIGQPNEISIVEVRASDGRYINYVLYYTSMDVLIFITNYDASGANSDDPVQGLWLNVAPNDPNLDVWILSKNDFRQPWLGFGHLEEYLLHAPPKLQ
jgi:hypothetical protein